MRKLVLVLVVVLAIMLPTLAFSQSVAQVTTVEVPAAKQTEYVAAVKALIPTIKKHSPSAKVRIWQATVAGQAAGRISVVVEFPNLAAWAEGTPKLVGDPAYQSALRKFESMGRMISSVTLASEL